MTTLHTIRRGEGPAVLFVHGLDSDAGVWESTIDMLPDHECVAVDLPGHGLTPASQDPTDYERPALLADLDEVIATITSPVIFVGHSLGGYLGLAHALTRPGALAGLVLVSTGPGFRDPAAREAWNDRVRQNAADYGIPEAAAAVAFHTDALVIDRLSELTLPIRMVVGSDDKAYLGANDYMERKLPHAHRETVEGGRHYVMRSHPEIIAAAVRAISRGPTP